MTGTALTVMSTTMLVVYTTAVLLLCCLIQQLNGISLAPVYWNMSNPMSVSTVIHINTVIMGIVV